MTDAQASPGRGRRVALVTATYAPFRGGREVQIKICAELLARAGFQVSVVTQARKPRLLTRCLTLLFGSPLAWDLLTRGARIRSIAQGVEVVHVGLGFRSKARLLPRLMTRRFIKRVRGDAWDRRMLAWIDREIGQGIEAAFRRELASADLVHCHSLAPFERKGREHASSLGKALVVTPYYHPGAKLAPSKEDLDTYLTGANAADAVLSLLPTDSRALRSAGIDRPIFEVGVALENERPLYEAAPPSFSHAPSDAEPMVLFLGRMVEYKGFRQFVDAAGQVLEKSPRLQFVLAGPDGSGEAGRAVARLGSPRVRCLGEVDEIDKARLLNECTVLCLPSTEEVFPVAICEAWSHGKPVIGGPAYGFKELIEGCGGGVVVPQEAGAIAEAIRRVIRNPDEAARMGSAGRSLIRGNYLKEHLLARTVAAYEATWAIKR